MDNPNPVDTRMRADNILFTKLVGVLDVSMITAVSESVSMYFGRIDPTDWIIDATGVSDIKHDTIRSLAELLKSMHQQNGRHFFLVAKHPAVRMHASSASWTAGAQLAVMDAVDEAVAEIANRLQSKVA